MALKIIVCGAGEVGSHIAALLSDADHDVTVIDTNGDRVDALADSLDISTLAGSCTSGEVLIEAGVRNADLVVACTQLDEVNLLTAAIAKKLGAGRTVARVGHRVFFESGGLDYSEALGIDGMICPDYSTAQAIARVLRNPGASAIQDFGQDEIEIQEFVVSPGAPAVGNRLMDIKMPSGALLAAINRDGKVFVPHGEAQVFEGDKVVLVGNAETFQLARKLFHQDGNGHLQVVIMGGSATAVWLCRALRGGNFRIRLFEPQLERATFLSNKLDWVTVVQENVIEPNVFEEEKIGQAGVFVACCEDDERNILSCVWAKNNGVEKVIAVASRSDYLDLLKLLGVDYAFSPRNEAADEIENFLVDAPLRILASLADGVVDVYRVPVGRSAKCEGKTIAELGRAGDWIIAAIRRKDDAFVPTAADLIEVDDILIVVGGHGITRTLSKLFDASRE